MINTKEKKEKKEYVPPKVDVIYIKMEQGIAAGSAVAQPQNPDETWTDGGDQTGELDW
ncbi:hypothetical protein VO54_01506 [Elizabethkingia miricola]|nr:hypothetical protein VO54_01506 [Elizabethkingia miricola]